MLTFMTYNIFSGRLPDGGYDLDGKIGVISQYSPDVLGLNEVHRGTLHSSGRSQTDDIADALGMKRRFFARSIYHNGGEYGIALLSKHPFVSARVVPIPDADVPGLEPRVIVDAIIDSPDGCVRTLISHFGLSALERQYAVTAAVSLLSDKLPLVLMGDLNTTPDEPILQPLFERLRDTAAGLPPRDMLTFASDEPTSRIDYIFANDRVETVSTFVPVTAQSDHRPVVAKVRIL